MNQLKKINEFEVNERVYGNFLIKSIRDGVTARQKPYLDITLADKTGEILAKVWDVEPQHKELKPNGIVYATGDVTLWDGSLQMKLGYIEPYANANPLDFVKGAPISVEKMMTFIQDSIDSIADTQIKSIVQYLFNEHKDAFSVHPAAEKMHHAIYSGLAYHVTGMLRSALALQNIYRFLNKDLMIAGVILHDIAKIFEMKAMNGVTEEYTRPGKLLGHIVQGVLMIGEAAKDVEIDPIKVEVLQHLVVSHHDKGEWGSPKKPQMPEAIMLHFIDNIDAKMYMVKEAIDEATDGSEFTKKIRGLDNQALYIYPFS